jgi:hypothetical protein
MLLLLAACADKPATPTDPAGVRLVFHSRGEGEIEPCG